jgi:hypothetical protein
MQMFSVASVARDQWCRDNGAETMVQRQWRAYITRAVTNRIEEDLTIFNSFVIER